MTPKRENTYPSANTETLKKRPNPRSYRNTSFTMLYITDEHKKTQGQV